MVNASILINATISGLLLGVFYGLVASGFSMVWASMKLVNVAHAVLMLSASYLAIILSHQFGFGLVLDFVVVVPVMFVVGAALYRGVLAYSYESENFETVSLVATFGLTIIIENVLLYFYGPTQQSISTPVPNNLVFGGIRVPTLMLIAAVISVASTLVLYYIIYRTNVGRSVRAAWQDQDVAVLYGVNPNRVRFVMFGLATALAAVAGVMLPAIRPVAPSVHWDYIVIVFIVVIIGSVGSLTGTMLVGAGYGLVNEILPLYMPTSWVPVVTYVVLLGFLLYRPNGLFEGWA